MVKNLPVSAGDAGSIPGQDDPLEEGMATHSSILAWRVPWTEEPAGYNPWVRKELDTTKQLTHTHRNPEVDDIIICILPRKIPWHREVKELAQRHTASEAV